MGATILSFPPKPETSAQILDRTRAVLAEMCDGRRAEDQTLIAELRDAFIATAEVERGEEMVRGLKRLGGLTAEEHVLLMRLHRDGESLEQQIAAVQKLRARLQGRAPAAADNIQREGLRRQAKILAADHAPNAPLVGLLVLLANDLERPVGEDSRPSIERALSAAVEIAVENGARHG